MNVLVPLTDSCSNNQGWAMSSSPTWVAAAQTCGLSSAASPGRGRGAGLEADLPGLKPVLCYGEAGITTGSLAHCAANMTHLCVLGFSLRPQPLWLLSCFWGSGPPRTRCALPFTSLVSSPGKVRGWVPPSQEGNC